MEEQIRAQKVLEENREFPFVKLLDHRPEIWQSIASFFGIDVARFPAQHLAYQQDTNKNIVFLGTGLNELMQYRRKNKLNVVVMGVKMFSKNKGNQISDCSFRIRTDGLQLLLPYLDRSRIISGTFDLFVDFSKEKDMALNFEQLNQKGFPEFQTKKIGSAILEFGQFHATIWIGKGNVSLMVSKEEIHSILSLN